MGTEHRSRAKQVLSNPDTTGSKIALLVDGDEPIRQAIVQVLRQEGYSVLEASGVLAAQRLADSHRNIRLVLADFSTPETSAVELARWFQLRFPETKVLITTSSLWELLYQTGGHEQFSVLVKPFSGSELRRIVRRLTADV
jgi:DNA-binding NtrC family response regulator